MASSRTTLTPEERAHLDKLETTYQPSLFGQAKRRPEKNRTANTDERDSLESAPGSTKRLG